MNYVTLTQAFKTAVADLQGAAVPSELVMRYVNDVCALAEPATNKVIDLSELTIGGAINFKNFTLPELNCRNTVFLGDVSSPDQFQKPASFKGARFEQDVNFFCSFAIEDVVVDFSNAVFVGFADFEGAIRHYFNFDDAQFLGGGDFD